MSNIIRKKIIENSGRPANSNAGRTLKLEEVWRITDENVRGSLISVHDNFVFIVDTDEDENFVIKKYRICNTIDK